MRRARLGLLTPLWLVSAALACQRGAESTAAPIDTDPEADAGSEEVDADLPIIAVPQRAIPGEPSKWTFDPTGRFVAVRFDEGGVTGCGVWEIESGVLMREHASGQGSPCATWPDGRVRPSRSAESADRELRATLGESGLEIEAVGDPSGSRRAVSGCASCGEDAMLVWAPSGHQLGTSNGKRLEVWDADTGERIRSDELDDVHDIDDLAVETMAWTTDGLVVVVAHEFLSDCEDLDVPAWDCGDQGYADDIRPAQEAPQITGYALSSFWWPPDGGPLVVDHDFYRGAEPPNLYTDPGARWVAFTYGERSHDSSASGAERLRVIGTMVRGSSLGWFDTYAYAREAPSLHTEGAWRVDGSTQWVGASWRETGDEYAVSDLELGWQATVAEPNPGFYEGVAFRGQGFAVHGELEVIAAASGVAVTVWTGCSSYDESERCEEGTLSWLAAHDDCELLDVSPTLALALVDCDHGLALIEAQGVGARFSQLSAASNSTWRWGRGGWLALLERGGKLAVVDLGSGRVAYERDTVVQLPEVPLAAQHDLLAIQYADHLELVSGTTGGVRIELAGARVHVALSPDGERLAWIDQGRLAVVELAGGATITSVEIGAGLERVAWRQDGAALFYGDRRPTRVADPETGELLGELRHPVLDTLAADSLDPSWRWIRHDDGSITRTLDFARIEIGPTWARTQSGAYDGAFGDLPEQLTQLAFRIGDDADTVPRHSAEELEPWLRRPGLVQAFFTGEPLPRPRIPASAAAKLAAGR